MVINLNGEILKASENIFSVANRGFRYGDGLFETIRVFEGKIPFFAIHQARLVEGMQVLEIEIPECWEKDFLETNIQKTILHWQQANQNIANSTLPANFRVRLAVFRADGGLYTPFSNKANFCIEITHLPTNYFIINEIGLNIGIFEEIKIAPSKLSPFKTSNSLPYILAALHKQKQAVDDCFLLNTNNQICESVAANIFLFTKENTLLTPPLTSGCIKGVMREIILQIAKEQKIKVFEQEISVADLQTAEEVFISNSIQGLQWVGFCSTLQQKYEKNEKTRLFLKLINEKTK
jgi:branched-subunit amino acid aminotransferase/4-amino-4-deoxychorismate lyase